MQKCHINEIRNKSKELALSAPESRFDYANVKKFLYEDDLESASLAAELIIKHAPEKLDYRMLLRFQEVAPPYIKVRAFALAMNIPVDRLDFKHLLHFLKNKNKRVRELAELLLFRVPVDQIDVIHLIKSHGSDDDAVRIVTKSIALNLPKSKLDFNELIKLQRSSKPSVRALAEELALKAPVSGTKDYMSLLVILNVGNVSAQIVAAKMLILNFKEPLEKHLLYGFYLDSRSKELKEEAAIQILRHFGDDIALPDLIEFITPQMPEVVKLVWEVSLRRTLDFDDLKLLFKYVGEPHGSLKREYSIWLIDRVPLCVLDAPALNWLSKHAKNDGENMILYKLSLKAEKAKTIDKFVNENF